MTDLTLTDKQHQPLTPATLEALVVGGDLSKLNPTQRVEYYTARCTRAGLDPATQPFQYLNLQGKLTLYATKTCTDQLSSLHGIRLSIIGQETTEGTRIVTVRAETRDGRATEEIGALPIAGLKGDALANALMKCVTKAKRRAVLSVCGLGMMDESEIETVQGAKPYASGTVSTLQPPAPTATRQAAPVTVQARVIEPEPQAHHEATSMEVYDEQTLLVYSVRVPVKVFDGWDSWKKYECVSKEKQATSKSALKEHTWASASEGARDGKREASLRWVVGKAVEEQDTGKDPSLFAQRCAVALYKLHNRAAPDVEPAATEDHDTVPW